MAQGDYGTPSNRVNITSERWKYTPHTSDPPNTEKGDEWLRVDMDSGDKIATLRFEYNDSGGVWDFPVFPTSETPDSQIKKKWRFPTPNGEGFVPLYEQGGTYPQRGWQIDGTRHGVHDSLSALPDSGGTHQWNYTEGTSTAVADEIGSLDLSFTGIANWPTDAGAGGTYAVVNGTDDYAELGSDELTSLLSSATGTFGGWCRLDNSNSSRNQIVGTLTTASGTNFAIDGEISNSRWRVGLTLSGTLNTASGGDPANDVGDWVFMAFTADGSTLSLYRAQPTGYDVVQLDSASISGSASGGWDYPVRIASRGDTVDNLFEGGMDIQFYDTSGWTESELQSFVDDTKGYYQ